MRGEDGAAARAWSDRDNGIDLCVDILEGESGHDLLTLEGEIGGVVEVLERAAAAVAIVGAARGVTVGAGLQDFGDRCAVVVEFCRHCLAGEGKGDKDLAAVVIGHAVALRAEAQNVEGDGRVRHGAMKQVPC